MIGISEAFERAEKMIRDRDDHIAHLLTVVRQARDWFLLPDNMDLPGSDAVFLALESMLPDDDGQGVNRKEVSDGAE